MTALYICAAFIAAVALVAFVSWVVSVYREEVARRDGFFRDPVFSPLDSRRPGRCQFTGRGAYDEDVIEPGNGYMPAGTTVHNADGSQVTDRDVINELMSGPVASWGNEPVMIPTEQKRRYVGPNSVTERSEDGRVVPFAKPVRRALEPPKSRSDANAPMPGFGLGSTRRSDPVYGMQTPSYPRFTAPKKAVAEPKKPVEIPEYMRVAADNGRVPSIRRYTRDFAAYGKLSVVPKD